MGDRMQTMDNAPLGWITGVLVGLLLTAGCAGPAPTPADYAARELPPEDAGRTGAARARVDRGTDAAARALRSGDVASAVRLAEAVIAEHPRSARARAILGRALMARAAATTPPDLDLLERAEGELLLGRRLAPADPVVAELYASFLEADGHLTKAAEVLEALLEERPDHPEALAAASRIRFELGEERVALPLLLRRTVVTPGDGLAHLRLGLCRVHLAEAAARGDLADARADRVAVARQQYLAAAEAFDRCRELAPTRLEGVLGAAHVRFQAALLLPSEAAAERSASCARALAILQEAEPDLPEHPGLHHGRGVILEYLGQPLDAKAAYEAALRRDAAFVPALLNLAHLLAARGQEKEARVFCQRALELGVRPEEREPLLRFLGGTGAGASTRPPTPTTRASRRGGT